MGLTYLVQGLTQLTGASWTNISGLITATNTLSDYCVPLPSPYKFFQVIENPGGDESTSALGGGAIINPALSFGTNGLCLSWPSQAGTQYDVQGKLNITNAGWTNIFGPITATGPLTTQCLGTNSPYHFFQISTRTGTTTSTVAPLRAGALPRRTDGSGRRPLQLVWRAEVGATYQVQFTTNLTPVVQWTTLTNLVPTTASASFTDTSKVSGTKLRFYRVVRP